MMEASDARAARVAAARAAREAQRQAKEQKKQERLRIQERRDQRDSVDRKLLTRPLETSSPEDYVIGAIARSRNSAAEVQSAAQATPLDREIAGYGFISQLRPGDTLQTPVHITIGGATYVLSEVIENPQGEIMLRGPDGRSVSRADILNLHAAEINKLLPNPPPADEQPEVAFVRHYLDSKANGRPIDRQRLVEAARSRGLLVADDIVALALSQGKITEVEAKILRGETPQVQQSDGSMDPPLSSERARNLQAFVQAYPVPNREQAHAAIYGVLEIPTNSNELQTLLRSQREEYARLETQRQAIINRGAEPDKIEEHAKAIRDIEQKMQALQTSVGDYQQMQEQIQEMTGSSVWDSLGGYYAQVDEGLTTQQSGDALRAALGNPTAEALRLLDEDIIDRQFAHEDKLKRDQRKKMMQTLITRGGGGILAINAILIWNAAKKRNEGGGG